MFGSSGGSEAKEGRKASPEAADTTTDTNKVAEDGSAGAEKPGDARPRSTAADGAAEKKRRSSGVGSKASSFLASAKNSLLFNQGGSGSSARGQGPDATAQASMQRLGKQDPALSVPQGQYNNSAGESNPGPRSTFKVGVWEDRNKKCRRTMEDTHSFLYNFLHTPAPSLPNEASNTSQKPVDEVAAESDTSSPASVMETDNGYFAIFDGHAGTFAADWCGKKLHIILEETIRNNPNTPIPELLDQTFTSVDAHLEKLPVKNSGCTAVAAVLRWEDRIPNAQSATGSTAIAPATVAAVKAAEESSKPDEASADSGVDMSKSHQQAGLVAPTTPVVGETHARLKSTASRQRVLYTANVGDARIVLCRKGKALRLSYDHKGSDELEGKRIANAGGLILNNRVNGVLAVTRALGDSYMKDLVTGHPYTTETVIQPEADEFIILACDGLWDVCSDQEACDLIRNDQNPSDAAKKLVDYALARFSTDNLSCMVVRFNRPILVATAHNSDAAIGVEGDPHSHAGKISEVEKIVEDAKRMVENDGRPPTTQSAPAPAPAPAPAAPAPAPASALTNDGAGSETGENPVTLRSMEDVIEEEADAAEGEPATDEISLTTSNPVVAAASEETIENLKLPEDAASKQ